ncbi:MAG: hypothetical protein HY265_07960 [Deltaproteobacteria bacterium]|nr:hypothetical protein [Deltaproteobacteria bacterium]MBI3756076.1 hypothetical protein [Deltaproteobacteria bacterium]
MKRKISITQKLLLFASIFFVLAISYSRLFINSIKEFDRYADISTALSSIKNDIAEMEYGLDIYVIGGYYKGEGGIEGIYEKVAVIDKQIDSLQKLSDVRTLIN